MKNVYRLEFRKCPKTAEWWCTKISHLGAFPIRPELGAVHQDEKSLPNVMYSYSEKRFKCNVFR